MGAQIFVGTESEVCDAQGLKSPKQFVNSCEDNIQKHGVMDKLNSNRAQTEIGKHAHNILQALFISSWQSEPHQQQQNLAEHKYQTLKRYTNTILSRTGALENSWLLCLLYVCFLLNCLDASHSIGELHLRLLKVLHLTSVCYFISPFGTLCTTS